MSSPVGTRGPDYEMVVERGKIAEFAAAMQSQNPAYAGPDAIAPPTFLISASLWAPDGAAVDVGFDRRRLLHGEQEFIFHGPPPRAGQALTVSDQIVDRYEKPGKRGGLMRFAVVVTEYRGEDGALVAEARRTLIETAQKAGAS
jgi:N-terminal half of MaoC dehydratase